MLQDVRIAVRTLLKRPGYALSVVATLALGIGASTMMFSLLDAAVLRPLAFRDPQRLVMLWGVAGPDRVIRGASFPEVADWRSMNRTLADVAVYDETSLNFSTGSAAARVDAEMVSASYFDLLGAHAALGRTFLPEEDRAPDANPVAVISNSFWRQHFGGASPLNTPVFLNDRRFTIVGVMPDGFAGISYDTDVWIPSMMVSLTASPSIVNDRGTRWLGALARLKDGVTMTQAQEDLNRIAAILEREHPDTNRQRGVQVVNVQQSLLGTAGDLVTALFGAVLLFLVIACANVASLQLARTMARRRDLAIRLALGAGRWRIARQLLGESLVLSALAGIAGALLAAWSLSASAVLTPQGALPRYVRPAVDLRALAFVAFASMLCGALVAVLPAFRHTRRDLTDAMKTGARSVAGGLGTLRRRSPQQLLVAGEIALAMILLTGAGLLARSLERQMAVRLGFSPADVTVAQLTLPGRYAPEQRAAFAARLDEELARLPQVTATSVGSDMPLTGSASASILTADSNREQGVRYYRHSVTPGYFRTLGIAIVQGREFNADDRAGAPLVAIVSEASARRLWGDSAKAIARTFRIGSAGLTVTVVGVAANARFRNLTTDITAGRAEPDVFFPFAQRSDRDLQLAVRSPGRASVSLAELQRAVGALDAALPVYAVQPLDAAVRQQTATARFGSALLALFSAGAVLLAAIGLYGLVSYVVGLSGREIAIRIALGADRQRVVRLVVKNGMTLAAAGVLFGLLGSALAGRTLESHLFQTPPVDAVTFAAVACALLAIAAIATYFPARRAARIDPQSALRAE